MWEALTPETWVKGAAYVCTVLYVGAATSVALSRGRRLTGVSLRVARAAAAAGVAALLARLVFHASAAADGAFDAETFWAIALESRWGSAWRWQLIAAAAAAAVTFAGGVTRGHWGGAAVAAATWCAVTPLLGHGATSSWQHVTHAAHLAVTGSWLGTVAVFAVASLRVSATGLDELASSIRRFSPWALACAVSAAASGTLLAWHYLGTLDALVAVPYGRLLLLKLAGIAAVGVCGALNWQRARTGRRPSPSLLRAEAFVAVVVVMLTAVLSETEHPGD